MAAPEKRSLLPRSMGDYVYAPWLKAVRQSGQPFYEFAYDWRRDLLESSDGLEKFAEAIKAKHPGEKIQVVSHSMGGYLSLAVLNRRPEFFNRMVFVGVPFTGGLAFLPDMQMGSATGLNKRVLSPRVLFSFPSIYCLFPENSFEMVAANGQPAGVDFFNAEDWYKYHLGVFSDPTWEANAQQMSFLTTLLKRAKKMKEMMRPRPISYPPVVAIVGKEQATLARVQREVRTDGGISWDFKSLPKEPGDGRVCLTHALPPAGIPYTVFYSKAEHSSQLNDPEVIRLILDHP